MKRENTKISIRLTNTLLFVLPAGLLLLCGISQLWGGVPEKAVDLVGIAAALAWAAAFFLSRKKGEPEDEMARRSSLAAMAWTWVAFLCVLAAGAVYCDLTDRPISLTAAALDFLLAGAGILYAVLFLLIDRRGAGRCW